MESIRPPRGPPINFDPGAGWSGLRFRLIGWPLFTASMHRLARTPINIPSIERASLQRAMAARLLKHLRVRIQYRAESPPPTAPHIIVALHEGLADVLCLLRLPLARPIRFVARAEILEWPWIGAALQRMKHIGIEPERGAASYRALIAGARDALQAGEHVVLFPQGAVLGIETAFQPGAFRLARLLHAPILPVVLTGAHRIWEHPFSPRVRYGQPVGMIVLQPLSVADVQARAPDAVCADVQRRMKALALSCAISPRHFRPERDGFWDGFAYSIDERFTDVFQQIALHRQGKAFAQGSPRESATR